MRAIAPLDLADPAVADAVLALQRAAYRVEADLIGDDRIPPLHEPLADLVACDEAFLGCREDGVLVGVVSSRRADDVLDVHRLAVDPAHHRRGVARALLAALLAAHGDVAATVRTGALNAPALALYAALGFAVVGEEEPVPGLRVAVLRRPLSRPPA